MKRLLAVFLGLFTFGSLSSAQVLEGFGTKGSLGIFKDAGFGTLTDSIYQTTDPANSANGVMGVALDLKGSGDKNAIRPVTQQLIKDVKGALYLTYWVFIPANSTIPDSLAIGLWWQVPINWQFNEVDYYAKDIPKGRWYPLSAPIQDSSIVDPANNLLAGHGLGDFGIQWNSYSCGTTVWKGAIYVDSASLIGSTPTVIWDFKTNIEGFSEQWNNGWKDSVYWNAGPIGDTSGVGVFELKDGTASTGATAFGFQPTGSGMKAQGMNALVFWVYVPPSFPDTFFIQTWAQSDPDWNWPPNGPRTYSGKKLPKNTWFPLYFDLAQASILDSASGNFFNTFNNSSDNLRKLGIQVGGNNGVSWQGKIYVKNVALVNQVVVAPKPPTGPPVWALANFDNAANGGKQGFYVPAWAAGSVSRYLDNSTSKPGYVLQCSANISPSSPKFAAVRDSVVMQKADSIVTKLTCAIYIPSTMPYNGIVKFYVTGGLNDSIAVAETLGVQLQHLQWSTLSINKLDSLALAGKFDPTKPSRIGVVVYYPSPYDTTTWTDSFELDDFTAYGIWFASGVPSGIRPENPGIVYQYQLYSNYPNPFNPSTRVRYDVERDSKVEVKVFDVLGREVATLVNQREPAGSYDVEFNASSFSSGVYFVRMDAGSYVKTMRIMLLK